MAFIVAKGVVTRIAEKVGCSEERANKLGCIAAIATGDLVGFVAENVWKKYKGNKDYARRCPALLADNMHHYDSEDGDEDDREVEGIDHSEGHHHKELASIQPFLQMAMVAYSDASMTKMFPFVQSSQLIRDLEHPTKLWCNITTDTEVHVCILKDGTLAFVFRGTEPIDWTCPLGDILTDLLQNQVPLEHYDTGDKVAYKACGSVKVHKGFKLTFQDVTRTRRENENLRLVAEGLGMKEAAVRRVVCIGHSLGGALATLCAHWCRYVAYPHAQVWCVTIGSPRVGNLAFAREFNKHVTEGLHSYRVVNKGDVVPSIPHLGTYPKIWSAYKHVGGLIYLYERLTSEGTIFVKRGGRRQLVVQPSFLDHSCVAYLRSIEKVLESLYKHGPPRITVPPITERRPASN